MAPSYRMNRTCKGPQENRVTRKTRAGTTLIEVLVVIVIFLVGILAVIQIFPKGLGILVLARTQSEATALARDEVERLKAHSEGLPDAIVASYYDSSNNLVLDANRNPNDLGPTGDGLTSTGNITRGGVNQGNWMRNSGANAYRTIIGETHQITAPRQVGSGADEKFYGGLVTMTFAPLDERSGFKLYSNNLNQVLSPATDIDPSDSTGLGFDPRYARTDDSYYVRNAGTANVVIGLPRGPLVLPNGKSNLSKRLYYLSFSAYVRSGTTGAYTRRDFRNLPVDGINPIAMNANGVLTPFAFRLATILPGGLSLGSVDIATLRVSRGYALLGSADAASTSWEDLEPYAYRMLPVPGMSTDPTAASAPILGSILVSPNAFGQTIAGPNGNEPLVARADYTVYDWRILREEFRIPYQAIAQHQLSVPGLLVGGMDGPDGLPNPVITPLEDPGVAGLRQFNHKAADNFVIMDLDTGGVICESDPAQDNYEGPSLVSVNKTTGVLTIVDQSTSAGTQAKVLLPDGVTKLMTIDTRAVRVLYRTRYDMAVQVLKSASSYDISPTPVGIAAGQYYVGGSGNGGSPTRIYFPFSDLGQKVTFGIINYTTANGVKQMLDQDFVVRNSPNDTLLGRPYVDITDIDPTATGLNFSAYGYAVRNVKGSSITVRTLWNPDSFKLTNDSAQNMQKLEAWGRGYRRSTSETFLERGDLVP